jgi:hypothetical protein
LYVANLAYEDENGKTVGDLDLTKCPSLRIVDSRNSTFSSVTLADNAPVKEIYLNKPSTINFSNLTDVEDFII